MTPGVRAIPSRRATGRPPLDFASPPGPPLAAARPAITTLWPWLRAYVHALPILSRSTITCFKAQTTAHCPPRPALPRSSPPHPTARYQYLCPYPNAKPQATDKASLQPPMPEIQTTSTACACAPPRPAHLPPLEVGCRRDCLQQPRSHRTQHVLVPRACALHITVPLVVVRSEQVHLGPPLAEAQHSPVQRGAGGGGVSALQVPHVALPELCGLTPSPWWRWW